MIGHASSMKKLQNYLEKFLLENIIILVREYNRDEIKENLWEYLYLEYIDVIKLKARIDDNNSIFEFDSFNDLRNFDSYYLNYSGNEMLNNISNYFQVPVSDIVNIHELKEGLTNLSFKFDINSNSYVYRHPGDGTENIINRDAERFAQEKAKELKIDESFIYMDKEKGFKILHYIENFRILDYHSERDLKLAMSEIK